LFSVYFILLDLITQTTADEILGEKGIKKYTSSLEGYAHLRHLGDQVEY
jgi:hypothetical protein